VILEGKIAFTASGKTRNLKRGQFRYLPAGELHAVRGVEDASLLLTIQLTNAWRTLPAAGTEVLSISGITIEIMNACRSCLTRDCLSLYVAGRWNIAHARA
jgi:hypothetical protein